MNQKPKTKNQFVSRGGIKLQAALDNFQVNVKDKTVLDVGSSTGGFVDCLLQNGAKSVFAVDTSYGELAWKLRNDPRVVVMERTNILHLDKFPFVIPSRFAGASARRAKEEIQSNKKGWIPDRVRDDEEIGVDLVTIDAGWTKLELVLPVVKKFLKNDGQIIALLKPQYEAKKDQLSKGVVPQNILSQVKEQVCSKIKDLGFRINQEMESPILGGGGNREFLLLIK